MPVNMVTITEEEYKDLLIKTTFWKDYQDVKKDCERYREEIQQLNRKIHELELWKQEHSGNYRKAGRKRNQKVEEQKWDWWRYHFIHHDSYPKIANIVGSSYYKVRQACLEAADHYKEYGHGSSEISIRAEEAGSDISKYPKLTRLVKKHQESKQEWFYGNIKRIFRQNGYLCIQYEATNWWYYDLQNETWF